MAGNNPTTTEYIQHHLSNLTYGQLPAGYERYDGTVLSEATWTMAHGSAEAAAMGFSAVHVDSLAWSFGLGVLLHLPMPAARVPVGPPICVGLVVPHIIRMIIGPAHRGLIVASAVGGGALLVLADLLTRTMVAGAELPIGMLTSLIGGPFFFYLLWRQRRRSGGWA